MWSPPGKLITYSTHENLPLRSSSMLEPQSFCSNELESDDFFNGNWTGGKSDTLLVRISFHFLNNFRWNLIPEAGRSECPGQWGEQPGGEYQHLPRPPGGEPRHGEGRQEEEEVSVSGGLHTVSQYSLRYLHCCHHLPLNNQNILYWTIFMDNDINILWTWTHPIIIVIMDFISVK